MAAESDSAGPLSGLRVVDLTGRKGGYCGLLLANLGAEVSLVEPPGGDPHVHSRFSLRTTSCILMAAFRFAAYHTNKHGMVLDLENDEGQTSLRHLVTNADVLIEDRPVGYLAGIGLGSQALRLSIPRWSSLRSPALLHGPLS